MIRKQHKSSIRWHNTNKITYCYFCVCIYMHLDLEGYKFRDGGLSSLQLKHKYHEFRDGGLLSGLWIGPLRGFWDLQAWPAIFCPAPLTKRTGSSSAPTTTAVIIALSSLLPANLWRKCKNSRIVQITQIWTRKTNKLEEAIFFTRLEHQWQKTNYVLNVS